MIARLRYHLHVGMASVAAMAFFASACASEAPVTDDEQAAPVASASSEVTRGDILAELQKVPGVVDVREEVSRWTDARVFSVRFEQPADHLDPRSGTFTQRLTLLFRAYDVPMVLDTSGYMLPSRPRQTELTGLLRSNQITVEHRFFRESFPNPVDWKKLNIFQMATDEHRIIQAFRPLFAKKWASTGESKGGMTQTYHRFFYPNDVAVTVPYVAPNNLSRADSRYIDYLANVGGAQCRDRFRAFETEILAHRRAEFEARLLAAAAARGETFDALGIHIVLDDLVTWTTWTYWQFEFEPDCSKVPLPTATTDELYAFFEYVYGDPVSSDADSTLYAYAASSYQKATELGGPGCDMKHLEPFVTPGYTCTNSEVFPPFGVEKRYRPYEMPLVGAWVTSSAKRMLYIYGERDPWTAGAFSVSAKNDSYRYIVPASEFGANHLARIRFLPEAQANEIYERLGRWMDVTIVPPPRTITEEAVRPRLARE